MFRILETNITEKYTTIIIVNSFGNEHVNLRINKILKAYNKEIGIPDNIKNFYYYKVTGIKICDDTINYTLREISYYKKLKSIKDYLSINDNLIINECNEEEEQEAEDQSSYC